MELKGRVAWVTGGGRGIGRACAEALARAGANVAVSARTRSELDATVAGLGDRRGLALPCDVTDLETVAAAHRAIVDRFGPPDIVVPAAGVARSEPFHRTTSELMRLHWEVNVLGAFHALKATVPGMVEREWGRVVAVASVAGKAGAPYVSAYASSKHALLGLVRSLAAEVAGRGVTVNAVCPGYVDTRMTQENVAVIARKTGLAPGEALGRLLATNPQNRLIDPQEVASTVVHLCGSEARSINGQSITIDGGAQPW